MSGPRLYARDFWVACALHVAGGMSLSMFLLVPLFIKSLGGDELTIGLVLGVGTAASVAARPAIGVLLDRVGRRRMLVWGGALNALSYLPFTGLQGTGVWLYVWSTVHEVMWGWLFAAYFTYAADLVPPDRRAEGIAVFGVAGMLTNGLGPALGEEILARATWPTFFLVAAGFGLVALGITALVPPDARRRGDPAPGSGAHGAAAWRVLAGAGLGRVLVATVVLGAAINAAFFFVAPFTRALGIARAGPFFAAYAGTSVVLRILGRRLLDDLGPHRVAIPGFLLFAVGLASLGLLPRGGILLLAGVACGAAHGVLFPVLNALAIARTPPPRQGTVVSIYTGALDLGGVVGIPFCGAVADGAGYRPMFAIMATANALGAVLMVADRTRAPTALAPPDGAR